MWWMEHARSVTIGYTVLVGEKTRTLDLKHEVIHLKQYRRAPFIHPFLYYWEIIRKGYGNNKYEEEAYSQSYYEDGPRKDNP